MTGYVPIGSRWRYVHNPGSYWPAFDLDGVEWAWRNDGSGVWTLIQLVDPDLELEMFERDDQRGRVREF